MVIVPFLHGPALRGFDPGALGFDVNGTWWMVVRDDGPIEAACRAEQVPEVLRQHPTWRLVGDARYRLTLFDYAIAPLRARFCADTGEYLLYAGDGLASEDAEPSGAVTAEQLVRILGRPKK